jgi:PadR family transcriptional regulator PadR
VKCTVDASINGAVEQARRFSAVLTMSRYLLIVWRMRRKAGCLVPIELAICEAAAILRQRGSEEFHGYQIAREIQHSQDNRLLTAYGTLYRALGRLERMGLLEARWEDPLIAAEQRRPPRRFYELTTLGDSTLAAAQESRVKPSRLARKRPATA